MPDLAASASRHSDRQAFRRNRRDDDQRRLGEESRSENRYRLLQPSLRGWTVGL